MRRCTLIQFPIFVFEKAYSRIENMVLEEHVQTKENVSKYNEYKEKMTKMNKEAEENCSSLEEYINRYTNTFLFMSGIPTSDANVTTFTQMLFRLNDMGLNN